MIQIPNQLLMKTMTKFESYLSTPILYLLTLACLQVLYCLINNCNLSMQSCFCLWRINHLLIYLFKRVCTSKQQVYLTKFFFFLIFQIQIFGFNSQLYSNFSEALHRAQGIVAISLLMQVSYILIRTYHR